MPSLPLHLSGLPILKQGPHGEPILVARNDEEREEASRVTRIFAALRHKLDSFILRYLEFG
jgi:hypothetical protein